MNKKGESVCGILALFLLIVSFVLIQMQFNGFSDAVDKNKESNDYIKSVFWKQGEAISNIKQYYLLEGDGNHGHTGIYGPVRRLMSE